MGSGDVGGRNTVPSWKSPAASLSGPKDVTAACISVSAGPMYKVSSPQKFEFKVPEFQ